MYAKFFGLRELPFNNTPDPRFFYSTPDHEEALASLVYAVQARKGFVLLTGEVGAGKTLVSRMMLRQLGAGITFAHIHHGVSSARDLMESLCSELELRISERASLTQLTRALHDFLLARFAQNIPVVLVLDEAQNLPIDAFEQLRMIGNLEADDAKLLQIAIVGQPELQRMFASPELRQLRQRIFRSFHLPALDRQAAEGYIRHRLEVAGAERTDIFAADAIDRIHEISRGLPRIINTTCDNTMLSAYSGDRTIIDRPFVDSVAEQMTSEPHAQHAVDDLTGPHHAPRPGAHHTGEQHVHLTGLTGLLARVQEIEGRVRSLHPAVPLPSLPSAMLAAPLHTAAQGRLETLHCELQEMVGHLAHRVAALENGLRLTPKVVSEARGVVSTLEPLVQRAEDAVGHTQTACGKLKERQQKLESAAAAVRTILERLGKLLTRCEQTSAEMKRGQQQAASICTRLTEQSARSQQIADGVGQLVERTLARKHVELPVCKNAHDPEKWQEILHGTRDSLARLRSLARRTAQYNPQRHGSRDRPPDQQQEPLPNAHEQAAVPQQQEPAVTLPADPNA